MAEVDLDKCYAVIMEAVEKASEIIQKGFASTKTVKTKTASHDIVTEYDRKIEDCLIGHLSKVFPTHKFIGEETFMNEVLTDEPTWIIDPIDGTANFVHSYPYSAICAALCVRKEILIGIVCNPMMNQLYTAIKGRGSFLNGKKLSTSKIEELNRAVVGYEISLGAYPQNTELYVKRYRSCVTQCQGMRSIGCAQLSLCLVASGLWDAYHVEHLFPWDIAAGALIITEAGGTIIDVYGSKLNVELGRCIAAGTESLARKLVTVFNVS
ncbi:hypothetical protein O3M35_003527 [Rhynocoris fuscipes]|uniref:Inositol-1-monophosphatase n=1 Tax=Rhynocoris fuscipes TaxID=488301 RepID=A0AAW1CN92_9HEMI